MTRYRAQARGLAIAVLLTGALAACGGSSSPLVPTYTLGGTASGLGAGRQVVLRSAAGDVTVSANGPFTFPTPLADGTGYAVTVLTQPTGQSCSVAGGTGTVLGAAVTSVAVSCGDTGTLDTTFGPGGVGLVHHGGAAGGDGGDLGEAMALDASGRILVAGFSADAAGVLHMAAWRFLPDGALDASFHGTGFVTHPGESACATCQTIASGVAVDGSGRVVVTGYSIGSDGLWGVALWRYTAGGQPDTSFGGTGFVRATSPQGGGVRCALDASGRILVAGFTWSGTDWDIATWRYLADGTPDPTFGGTGLVTSHGAAGGSAEDTAVGIAVDGGHRILVTGYSTSAAGDQDMTLLRYLPSGALDATFNGTGIVTHDGAGGAHGDDAGRDVAVDALGRVVVAGWSPSLAGGDDVAVWRFLADGTLDTSFGGTGYFVQDGAAGGSGPDEGRAVAVDGLGRIVVTGSSTSAAGDTDMVLWRLGADGAPDASLGGGSGRLVFTDGAGGTAGRDGGRDLLIDGSGRLVVAGLSGTAPAGYEVSVWRIRQ